MSKLLAFSATDDGVDDDGESVKLVFGSVAGVTRGVRSEATVTIEDNPDDVPAVTVNFARSSYTAAEDGTVEVELTLSPAPEREVVIPIVRTNERNASDADYVPPPTTVTFASGDTLKSITFTPVDDAIDDDGERVRLALGATLPRLVSRGGHHGGDRQHHRQRHARRHGQTDLTAHRRGRHWGVHGGARQ